MGNKRGVYRAPISDMQRKQRNRKKLLLESPAEFYGKRGFIRNAIDHVLLFVSTGKIR